jgi:hypothetical protein
MPDGSDAVRLPPSKCLEGLAGDQERPKTQAPEEPQA